MAEGRLPEEFSVCNRQPPRFPKNLIVMLPIISKLFVAVRFLASDVKRRNPWWLSARIAFSHRRLERLNVGRWTFPVLVLLSCLAAHPVRAQHIHVQTAFTASTGWDLFWYDFESGPFPADYFTQPLPSSARGQIPDDPALTNVLGVAGSPVWTLPQFEASGLPALGLGAQGSADALAGGTIQLRLASFSGPGEFALHSSGAFGETTVYMATKDGLSSADAIGLVFPGGHVHANWSFTRPGAYELGFRAYGIVVATGQPTNSAVTVFRFRVADLKRPMIQVERTDDRQAVRLRVLAEAQTPLRLDVSSNAVDWTPWTNLWLPSTEWSVHVTNLPSLRFFRAVHTLP